MISIREQSYGLNVALYNEFTLDDFRQLEEALLAAKQKIHLPDILLDLSMLKDFTIDMAVEQIKFLNMKPTSAALPSLPTTFGSNSARAFPAS